MYSFMKTGGLKTAVFVSCAYLTDYWLQSGASKQIIFREALLIGRGCTVGKGDLNLHACEAGVAAIVVDANNAELYVVW